MVYMFLPMDRDDFCPTGRYYHADPLFHSESEATQAKPLGYNMRYVAINHLFLADSLYCPRNSSITINSLA